MGKKMIRGIHAFAAAALAAIFSAPAAQAQSVADFFRGKTLRVVIPTAPGGDRALYAAPVVSVLGKHIPGNPTVVASYMPGAGGANGIN